MGRNKKGKKRDVKEGGGSGGPGSAASTPRSAPPEEAPEPVPAKKVKPVNKKRAAAAAASAKGRIAAQATATAGPEPSDGTAEPCGGVGGEGGDAHDEPHDSDDDDDDDDDDDVDDEHGPVTVVQALPVTVTYCPVCTLPPDLCEYSGMFEKCKPWLAEYLVGEAAEAARLAEASEKGRVKKEPSAVAVKKAGGTRVREVHMESKKCSGRRHLTTVKNLDMFGLSLKETCQVWKKGFACGVSINEAPGQHDYIEVQGDVFQKIAQILISKHKIPQELIFLVEKTSKTAYCDL